MVLNWKKMVNQVNMKRLNNLYHKIYDVKNLKLADRKARKGKLDQRGVRLHDVNKDDNIINLHHVLKNREYTTSQYHIFKLYDPKEREVYQLPYYPDRITHHAILNILEPIFVASFTRDTYSCVKKRGIHGAYRAVKKSLKDIRGTRYCLKIDIKKFYPNINHDILKILIRRKIKDIDLLYLLDNIIDSAEGVPIGNYLSQFFANFYLTYFDHWLKEVKKVKYYFRYCDDMVILMDNKRDLHNLLSEIREYLKDNLELDLKSNYQVFPISKRGLDFVGYRFYHTHILLRKGIKKRFVKMIRYNRNEHSIASYWGWLKYCNSKNLKRKYLEND